MNRLILPTLALALTSSLAFAQTTTAPQDTTPAPKQHTHTRNPQKEVAHLSKRLNLTADQQSKLEPIFADRDQKLDAIRTNTALAPQDAHAQMKAINKSTNQQLSGILTPDQMSQLHAGHQGHKGATQPLNAPPPSA